MGDVWGERAVEMQGEGFEERRDELWDRGQSYVVDDTDMLHLFAVMGHWQRCAHTYGLS